MLRRLLALGCIVGFLSAATTFAQSAAVTPAPPKPHVPVPNARSGGVTRQITYNSVYVEGPYIALTFDDGPHETLTPKLLDLLAKYRAKATFFVVGQNAAEYPDILRRMVREGHEIASHSWSHPNLGKMSDEAVRQQLQKTDDAIRSAIGSRPTLMRPPYGSITPRQKNWINDEFGYAVIMWDVDPLDWKRPGPSVVTSRILNGTRAGSIVLVHDIHPPSVEAMRPTLEQLDAKGFKFVTVSQLLAMERPAPPKSSPAAKSVAVDGKPVQTPLPLDSPAAAAPPARPR